ncbi:hypothetical protein AB0F18_15255 [Streptomyces sp. NPDC029216]|uniref:hypothetical protein n=1 Tax=Streptomyces sp. NPDC029216 TaxID=3154701 RepID=UPI0033E5F418
MGAERAQGGRGWVRIPASRAEQPPSGPATAKPYGSGQYGGGQYGSEQYRSDQYGSDQYGSDQYRSDQYRSDQYGSGPYAPGSLRGAFGPGGQGSGDPAAIYLSLVKRWREAGRTLPGHPDEEWERLISQPCWPGR